MPWYQQVHDCAGAATSPRTVGLLWVSPHRPPYHLPVQLVLILLCVHSDVEDRTSPPQVSEYTEQPGSHALVYHVPCPLAVTRSRAAINSYGSHTSVQNHTPIALPRCCRSSNSCFTMSLLLIRSLRCTALGKPNLGATHHRATTGVERSCALASSLLVLPVSGAAPYCPS